MFARENGQFELGHVMDGDRCKLSGIEWAYSTMRGVYFARVPLDGHMFPAVHLSRCEFIECALADTLWQNAYLQDVSFEGSDLSNAQFQRTRFKNVSFKGANVEGAVFTGRRSPDEWDELLAGSIGKPVILYA